MANEDRAFAVLPAGYVRDKIILTHLRNGLRDLVNPATGAAFTEDEIQRATQEGGRFFNEADAIDKVGLGQQGRAIYMADQIRIARAATPFLEGYHGRLWGEDKLSATGSSGPVDALATAGAIFVGSTTLGDPTAHVARDPAGTKFQVQTTAITPGSGVAQLTLVAVDTGTRTNIDDDTVLTWESRPLSAQPTCTATADFSGGTDNETDAEFADRLEARVRHKPASGNRAHFRGWARDASNAVEDAYVYPCFLYAGSILVCVIQKRAGVAGPNARIASATTLATVTAYIVPPGTSVVPGQAHVVVVTATPQSTNFIAQLAQQNGNAAGWADLEPWPTDSSTPATITVLTNQTHFRMHSDAALPTLGTPQMMVWDDEDSAFVELSVLSVTSVGGNLYDVVLNTDCDKVLAVGDYISPLMDRHETVADAAVGYFDELGPGEVLTLGTDPRSERAFRFPEPSEEAPYRAGQAILSRQQDALGSSLADSSTTLSATPGVPTDPNTGPKMLTLGKFAVYELP